MRYFLLLVCLCITTSVSSPQSLPMASERGVSREALPIEQLVCMQEAVYYEARGESFAGQVMVASVILNRMREWKGSACTIINEPWQFSYVNLGLRTEFTDRRAWRKAGAAVQVAIALDGRITPAKWYVVCGIMQPWMIGLKQIDREGSHCFYN